MSCCCCFPPNAKVLTTNGYVRVKNLTKQHKILVLNKKGQIRVTTFLTFLHFDSQLTAEYLVIQCDNGQEIIISESHLIYNLKDSLAKPVPASSISIGDSLMFVEENYAISYPKVVNITRKTIKGAFAPLTNKGALIVDGFKTSCYAEVSSHKLAHRSMAPLRAWLHSANFLSHGDNESKTYKSPENGIHGYANILNAVRHALSI